MTFPRQQWSERNSSKSEALCEQLELQHGSFSTLGLRLAARSLACKAQRDGFEIVAREQLVLLNIPGVGSRGAPTSLGHWRARSARLLSLIAEEHRVKHLPTRAEYVRSSIMHPVAVS